MINGSEQIDFSVKFKELISFFHLNQTEFAEILEVTPGYISLILAGTKTPSNKLINKLKSEFEIHEHWWETGDGEISILDPYYFNSELSQAKTQRDFVEKYISPEVMSTVDTLTELLDGYDAEFKYAAVTLLNKYIRTSLEDEVYNFLGIKLKE